MGGRKGAERDEEEGGGEHGCVVLASFGGRSARKRHGTGARDEWRSSIPQHGFLSKKQGCARLFIPLPLRLPLTSSPSSRFPPTITFSCSGSHAQPACAPADPRTTFLEPQTDNPAFPKPMGRRETLFGTPCGASYSSDPGRLSCGCEVSEVVSHSNLLIWAWRLDCFGELGPLPM